MSVAIRMPTAVASQRLRPLEGYFGGDSETAATIDADGWLHTGDVGEFDEEGYLKIVDRKKELIINAGGKNMSPANIEAKVKASSPLIGQAVAIEGQAQRALPEHHRGGGVAGVAAGRGRGQVPGPG